MIKSAKNNLTILMFGLSALCVSESLLAKVATEVTRQENKSVYAKLPFNNKQDFMDAKKGLLLKPDTLTIKNATTGQVVWDLESFKKVISLEQDAPDTINPSLWRNAQLNLQYGLFEVKKDIYQVRGYDLSNITFIRSKQGWIVFDVGMMWF